MTGFAVARYSADMDEAQTMLASRVPFSPRLFILVLVAWCLIAFGCSREDAPGVKSEQPSRESPAHELNTLVMWTS